MKPIISPFYGFVVSWLSLFTVKIRDGLILNYIYMYKIQTASGSGWEDGGVFLVSA